MRNDRLILNTHTMKRKEETVMKSLGFEPGHSFEDYLIKYCHQRNGSRSRDAEIYEDGIVDDMTLWDNTEKDNPRLIYDSKKVPPVIDEELFNRYKEKRNFVMTKTNNIEKAYDFGASEFNRKMKRITQDRLKRGLPVSLDIPNDATPEELEELKAFDAWTRDGQPVEECPIL